MPEVSELFRSPAQALDKLVDTFDDTTPARMPRQPQLKQALQHIEDPLLPRIDEVVNYRVIQWLGAFLDEGQAGWPMPQRELGFWASVKSLLQHDPVYRRAAETIKNLPNSGLEAIAVLMLHLDIEEAQQEKFLRDHLFSLPGWTGFIKWRQVQRDYPAQNRYPINLADYLAVRLLLQFLEHGGQPVQETPAVHPIMVRMAQWAAEHLSEEMPEESAALSEWLQGISEAHRKLQVELLKSWENGFRHDLSRTLILQEKRAVKAERPEAQMVFCIDVRSEPFRRQLEQSGAYETFGFAGFFGLPIAIERHDGKRVKSLPVLLQPAHNLAEVPHSCTSNQQIERYQHGTQAISNLKRTYKSCQLTVGSLGFLSRYEASSRL